MCIYVCMAASVCVPAYMYVCFPRGTKGSDCKKQYMNVKKGTK